MSLPFAEVATSGKFGRHATGDAGLPPTDTV